MSRKGFIASLVALVLLFPSAWAVAAEKREKSVFSGIASYYASRFHGRSTASGEPYDRTALTAAHPTFPFGTLVRVLNVRNGRSVVVRINDRGPFHGGRIIDLSGAAARALGFFKAGKARVKLEIVHLPGDDSSQIPQGPSPPDPAPSQAEAG